MSEKEFHIRRMEPKDAEEVGSLEAAIFSQPWSCQGFLDALSNDNVLFLVAESKQELIGYCGMYYSLDEGEITNVAVAEAWRKCGVGSRLLKQLLLEARQTGIRTVVLEVRVSNENAIHLYESLGFTIEGIRKGFYEKPKEDAHVMSLSQ